MEEESDDFPTKELKDFLENHPPGSWEVVSDFAVYKDSGWRVNSSPIQLHCPSEHCDGVRFFALYGKPSILSVGTSSLFLTYVCRNCNRTTKQYALQANRKAADSAHLMKFGEDPPFGPPTPSRVITLIGPDKDLFLRGRRAENQGLGIGAFAYYRRVVENQKNRVIDGIILVAKRLDAAAEMIQTLEKAKQDTQFTKAIERIKDGIPSVLFISGRNPLTLLHGPLSEGIHELSEDECLELATSVRVVLSELAERIDIALKDNAELKHAVTRLLNRRTKG